ncbi:uncharacterized protein LOC131009919 [Salvia miltiorrhiza]|uniref:uncharacterized protein LOC131009919 n=1 Tax=Salvia miltiorrhiza TaxID=226208 RepID=UPI0025ABA71E|nr:uncharacterized protein LOC131009919 [Salvia miltiorrhiza]
MRSIVCFLVMFVSVSCAVDRKDPNTQTRINHICSQTSDYNLCQIILNKNLYTPIQDFKGLTQICLAQTIIYTSDTQIFIRNSERNETSQTQRDLYKICESGYGILLNQFTDATFAFGKGDYKSMLFDIEKSERFVNDCENVLGNKITQLHDRNVHTRVLIQMSNASGNLIGSEL